MPDPAHFQSNLNRAALLCDSGRAREGVPFAQAAITADPENPRGYVVLAQCWNALGDNRAFAAIDRGIALDPHNSRYQGLKAWFHVCRANYPAARKAANAGLALNPNCITSLNSLANAETKLARWNKAEAACRRILALDPTDGPGLNLLAQALRHQGRYKESREVVAQILAQTPNDSFGHANAGHAALAAGDHLRANHHFLESLRLDPHSDFARRGLLSSLYARIWIIRINHRLHAFLRRPASLINIVLFIGGSIVVIVVINALSSLLNLIHPALPFFVFGAIVVFIVGWIWLSILVAMVARFLLIFDSVGRHAMTPNEKVKAGMATVLPLSFVCYSVYDAGHPWIIAVIVLSLLAVALMIQAPLWHDRLQQRRLDQSNS